MSFSLDGLRRLGNRLQIPIPKDAKGYFKIKPGTGLKGKDLPCNCPYCGHTSSHDRFWTKEQVEYAKSVALRQITDSFQRDLKKLEFEHRPRGPFGIGISLKVTPGTPTPIRYYREKTLETDVTCDACALQYAVFGVFAFCPDCGTHNSQQILQKNLDLVRKQLALAQTQEEADLNRHLVEDALENCVSAFDSFARTACRIRAPKSSHPGKCAALSFQHLPRAAARVRDLFGVDLQAAVPPNDWTAAHVGFMRRHLIAHKAGVVDQQYLAETGERRALLGRRIQVTAPDVERLAGVVAELGRHLVALLPPP
jgi:hypothetical protein